MEPKLESDLLQYLWGCATGAIPQAWYKFKRFERLSLWNLYHFQHDLVTFQEKLGAKLGEKPREMTAHDRQYMRDLLKEYCEQCCLQFQKS